MSVLLTVNKNVGKILLHDMHYKFHQYMSLDIIYFKGDIHTLTLPDMTA
jgi:hypothetical protein